MKIKPLYPFYKSLRFRFGLIFGLLFLSFLLVIIFFLYANVKNELEKSFDSRLASQANIILQKTEINPLTIPIPQGKEYFLITYNNGRRIDTIFNHLPLPAKRLSDATNKIHDWRSIKSVRTFETGGIINLLYVLPANELNTSLQQLQLILFIYIPLAFVIAFAGGYFLSGFLLKPVSHIINKANNTSLQNDIQLLEEPATKDELHHVTVAINRMLQRIQKQSQQQNAFFASASHELRTPLSIMLTELQVLELKNISPEIKAVIQNQLTEVQRLIKLVNDFLLMSQLKSNTIFIQKEMADLVDVCMNNIEKLTIKSTQKRQTFKIELQPTDGEFLVWADKTQLPVIMYNLLENAVKYGSTESVIGIIIQQITEGVLVSISNRTDVPPGNMDELKNEFRRQDFNKDGFGLGLWIVDQLAQKNNSKLSLTYAAQTFTATLRFNKEEI